MAKFQNSFEAPDPCIEEATKTRLNERKNSFLTEKKRLEIICPDLWYKTSRTQRCLEHDNQVLKVNKTYAIMFFSVMCITLFFSYFQ